MTTSGPSEQTIVEIADGVESTPCDGGGVRLTSPKFQRGPVHRFFARLIRRPDCLRVDLDAVGAFVVGEINGRTLGQLRDLLSARFHLSRREAETALGDFLTALSRRHLVRLVDAEGAPP